MSESANDMPSTSVALTAQEQKPVKTTRAQRLSTKMKRALDLMVWDCKTDNEAAVETGLTIQAIRFAIKQPHGRAYYRGQLEVLRQRESSANIHAMIAVRSQNGNQMAKLNAAIALEKQLSETQAGSGASATPGVVIVIQGNASVQSVPDTRLTQPAPLIIENDEIST